LRIQFTKGFQILLIICLGILIYANSLHGEFLSDDICLVKNNTHIKNWSNIQEVFSGGRALGCGKAVDFYRPMQMVSYMFDYSFWRLDPFGYHLTNLFLHILVSLCVFWMLFLVYKKRSIAFISSLLFLAHPLQVESVAYISGRADLLAALGVLLCFIFYLKQYDSSSPFKYALILLSYLFALCSKEFSLVVPAVLILHSLVFGRRILLKEFISISAISSVYILTRILGYAGVTSAPPTSFLQRLPGFFVALTEYFRLLFAPLDLHMDYGTKLFAFSDPKALSGLALLLLLVLLVFKCRRLTEVSFPVCWFLITLLPQSNLYPLNAFMSEHWLYLPSIGFFAVMANGLAALYSYPRQKSLAQGLLILAVFSYSYLTINQNSYWHDPITHYERTLQYAPDDWSLYYNLGINYADQGMNEKALDSFGKALQLNSREISVYCNLSNVYALTGDNRSSAAVLRKAIGISPANPYLYYLLGNSLYDDKQEDQALSAYLEAIQLADYVLAYNGIGKIYYKRGQKQSAQKFFNSAISRLSEVIKLEPDLDLAHNNLAEAYYYTGQYELALRHCNKALELGYKVSGELLDQLKPYRR